MWVNKGGGDTGRARVNKRSRRTCREGGGVGRREEQGRIQRSIERRRYEEDKKEEKKLKGSEGE